MTKLTTLHKRWLKTPNYREAFEESRLEFELAKELIEARVKSGLSQYRRTKIRGDLRN